MTPAGTGRLTGPGNPAPTRSSGGAQRAYDEIRRSIVEGRLAPGQRLVEQQLGSELGVSRTPVREALRRLQAEGLVRSEPNRGSVVRPLAAKDIVDLYELRARLEGLTAERAARAATPADVAELDRANAAFGEELAGIGPARTRTTGTVRRLSAANGRVHGTLVRMADHDQLGLLLTRTVDLSLVFQGFRQFSPAEAERSHLFHRLVVQAVAAHEPERAGRLMSEHILQGRDALLASLPGDVEVGDAPPEVRVP